MLTLSLVKAHLKLEPDATEEEEYLTLLMQAAWDRAVQITDNPYLPDSAPVQMAQLMWIGTWYANREDAVTGTITANLPMSGDSLLAPYRTYGL